MAEDRSPRRCISAVVCLLLLVAPLLSFADEALVFEKRTSSAFAVVVRGDRPPIVDEEALFRMLDTELNQKTKLTLIRLESQILASCDGVATCFAQRTKQALLARQESSARGLFLVANLARVGQGDRLSVSLISLDEDLDGDSPELAFREARSVETSSAAVALIREFVDRDVRARLDVFEPLVDIEVLGAAAGSLIQIDGRLVGPAGRERTKIRGVPVGHRTLELDGDPGTSVRFEAQVGRPNIVELSTHAPRAERSLPRLFGGTGLGVAGATLVTIGLIRAHGATSCIDSMGSNDCAGSANEPNISIRSPGASAFLPSLGVGLLAMGLTWIASELFEEPLRAPWTELLGLGVGGVAFSLTYGLTQL